MAAPVGIQGTRRIGPSPQIYPELDPYQAFATPTYAPVTNYSGFSGAGGSIPRNIPQSAIDPATGQPRPVGAPQSSFNPTATVPRSTLIPGTTTQRPVNVPYNPLPEDQNIFNDWMRTQGNLNDAYEQWGRGSISALQGDQANWESTVGGLVNQLPGITQQQNAARVGNTAGLRSMFEGLNASDSAALGTFNSRNADLYNTSVPMLSASQWSSNPQDIANQMQALGNFSGIFGGSLDYQAALATLTQAGYTNAEQTLAELYQYASDPSDVNRQKQAIEELHGLVNGGEWNKNLQDVTQKYKDLSNPEITAQERFILENFKQRREDLDRANREGVMSNLAARGLRSGAAEQTAMLNSQQELGRQSVLTELGAQANAIGRSQQAMQGWSQASQAGRQAQLAAMGMYVDASGQLRAQNDAVGLANTGWANQNSMFNAGQANDISMFNANAYNQNQMFNAGQANQVSMYNAGQTNNARANNQATRLAGAQGFANQSNAIRQSNDYVGTFNTGQQNLVNMQNQRVTLEDLQRKGNVAWNDLQGTLQTNNGIGARGETIHTAQQGDINSFADNQRGDVGAGIIYQNGVKSGRDAVTEATAGLGSSLYGPNGVFTMTNAADASGKWAINQGKYRLDRGQDIYG